MVWAMAVAMAVAMATAMAMSMAVAIKTDQEKVKHEKYCNRICGEW